MFVRLFLFSFKLIPYICKYQIYYLMDNEILKDLKNKEREIYSQLQSSMLFRQWEGIKSTILLYESNNTIQSDIKSEFSIPTDYSSDLTWADKFLFGLNRISEG